MKKVMVILAAFLLFGIYAKAMTESELETKLTATYTINEATFKANASQVTLIQRYLAQNELSESDCDYIASKVDEAVAIIDESGVTKLNDLSSNYRKQLSNLASEISANTSVKLTLGSNGTLTVYNTDGTVFTKITTKIKNTGNVEIIIIAGAISILGVLYFAIKARKAN